MKKGISYALPLAAVLLLAACSSAPKQMYYWKNYSPTIYEHLKNDNRSVGEQINKMEKYFTEAGRKQIAVAPGSHAHMGLLLIDAGQNEAARQHFETERRLFPESSVFMDFLLKSKGGKK
ncbi:DUF4810 domain-containing protein [Neisseria iguanae]|uniref:DUF4810 domain-containing protein n=1 Tax=Neisseria iguanae TaxID=90242 RepID=A0A2P7TY11_9NEIS|nr:DUF4810 domain-containing protein [Neisseria iguanae]PSJ79608.1 DUF4810 domain-containing protein [Neisseria iguanae]